MVRLNLRDHGETAHLNEEMFHSARTQEVVDAVSELCSDVATGPVGVLGYSLGGNFALRVARATGLPTLAVCPAVDPDRTMHAIDHGWTGYRLYFVRKWQQALASKQRAFPARYDFAQALKLRSVSALTDHFVRDHTDYPNTRAYFDRYTLTGQALAGTEATVVYAADDPVIPASDFTELAPGIELVRLALGGHCAFLDHPRRPSWIDRYAAAHFAEQLGSAQITPPEDSSPMRSADSPSNSR
ncbi:MAG: alpha/beta fold hydrolase [Pseudomonadales bacterium]|nr:alpha/beta fold hydrolase [Pseudomonadales bacterium]NIX09335.1 alpha/beta fold hydrolase [Pseudomonadales bacterium]